MDFAFCSDRIALRRAAQPFIHRLLAGHGMYPPEDSRRGAVGARSSRRRRAAPPSLASGFTREPGVGPNNGAGIPRGG